MKVIVPEGTELQGLERKLQTVLEQANLAGYALMGFQFREIHGPKLYEIDALVVMEPGIFVCIEAKGYKGKWTGSPNRQWFCNDQEIKSVNVNPYKQVERYSFVIKEKLQSHIFKDIKFWVHSLVVAPDETEFAIEDVVINRLLPGKIIIVCHLSKVEQVLGSMKTNDNAEAKFRDVGIEKIVRDLAGINPIELDPRIVKGDVSPRLEQTILSENLPIDVAQEPEKPVVNSQSNRPFNLSILAVSLIGIGMVTGSVSWAYYAWNNHRPCQNLAEVRRQGICYKDISKTPLVIGIVTSSEDYTALAAYIKEQLGSQVLDVIIQGNSETTYQEAQNYIAKKQWDIVFAFSPVNSMRAKDNGYRWIARMFPGRSSTYQSALFVRSDHSIQSINDITTSTTLALGEFSSASSFYIPAYDLYGKSLTVTLGHKSSKIIELVTSGQVDIGATVYWMVKDNSRFRVIHVSREIPGSGVYLSPQLSPAVQHKLEQILMNAPQPLKEEANYGVGEEPNYEIFRSISLRADEVLSCADFSQKIVQFFCRQTPQGIVGKISGFTNQGGGIVRFRLEEKSGKICSVSISSPILSRIPNGTSPVFLNRKQVSIVGVAPQQLEDGTCEITINNPQQLVILESDG